MGPIERLKNLREATDAAIEEAQKHRNDLFLHNAINWGDLGCVEAGEYQTDSGDGGLYVVIEEASPATNEFSLFICRELVAHGWESVEVRTEW